LGQSNPEVRDPPRELTPETDDDSGTLESEHREPPENLYLLQTAINRLHFEVAVDQFDD
jgi:hypothetical protein